MSEHGDLTSQFADAFPIEPIPVLLFWREKAGPFDSEFHLDLKERLLGRLWTEVSLADWRMIGTLSVNRSLLAPATFMYYVPSIILAAYQDMEFIDWALEAIIPFNQWHVPRRQWWFEFHNSASSSQRRALPAFLAKTRPKISDKNGYENSIC